MMSRMDTKWNAVKINTPLHAPRPANSSDSGTRLSLVVRVSLQQFRADPEATRSPLHRGRDQSDPHDTNSLGFALPASKNPTSGSFTWVHQLSLARGKAPSNQKKTAVA